MQEVIAPVDNIMFDIEIALNHQLGAHPLPFPGMDKSGAAICTFFMQKLCNKAGACPFRHVLGDRTVVCKHWLRGLCKKGDECEFLHEYDMSKMPECYFFSKFGQCNNKECPFLHIDPDKKIKDCPWYDRGYCRHGPHCKNRHVRRVICQCYLSGFCLDGPNCKYMHPKYDLPVPDPQVAIKKASIVCHYCGETGHKAVNCAKVPNEMKNDPSLTNSVMPSAVTATVRGGFHNVRGRGGFSRHSHTGDGSHNQQHQSVDVQEGNTARRPIESVTCFKCGEKGHYANKCPKGHLAFLSQNAT